MSLKTKFIISNSITNAITQIERTRGFLDAAHLSEEWVQKLQKKALILEAHHTTHIEGTHLTLEESEQILSGRNVVNADPDDVRELVNYLEAFDLVAEYVTIGEPITESVILEIHRRLVSNVRGNAAIPGEYRSIQNYIINNKTKEIVYLPPPPQKVSKMMGELVDWLHTEVEIHPVLVAGIAQFQLVHIHPFLDGNGRTARLLSTLYLYKMGYDFKRLFTISEYYDRDRIQYYKAIQSVRDNDMDMTGWLEYFTTGLATQLHEIQNRGQKVIRIDILGIEHGLQNREKSALELSLGKNGFSVEQYLRQFPERSKRTLQRDIKRLLDLGLIKAEGSLLHHRYFANF